MRGSSRLGRRRWRRWRRRWRWRLRRRRPQRRQRVRRRRAALRGAPRQRRRGAHGERARRAVAAHHRDHHLRRGEQLAGGDLRSRPRRADPDRQRRGSSPSCRRATSPSTGPAPCWACAWSRRAPGRWAPSCFCRRSPRWSSPRWTSTRCRSRSRPPWARCSAAAVTSWCRCRTRRRRGAARDTLVPGGQRRLFAQTYYDGPSVGQLVVSATGTGAYGFEGGGAEPRRAGGARIQRRAHSPRPRRAAGADYAAPVFGDTVTWVALASVSDAASPPARGDALRIAAVAALVRSRSSSLRGDPTTRGP